MLEGYHGFNINMSSADRHYIFVRRHIYTSNMRIGVVRLKIKLFPLASYE